MENLWTRCNSCQRILYKQDILENKYVCPSCSFHFRLSARERLETLFDHEKFDLLDEGIFPVAAHEKLPLVIVSTSGGARMQEGALSLMQLMKTSAALSRLGEARLPFISVIADPTTGGTTASYAMLGDINIGEPHALIGFAGPRVLAHITE